MLLLWPVCFLFTLWEILGNEHSIIHTDLGFGAKVTQTLCFLTQHFLK